ncbi:MAG: hypothetical protein JWM80_5378 [Cyanobacteria bacterium RYN_339]|nr:hypothetical protein [Cyanobacteria bacterium RYN_339]
MSIMIQLAAQGGKRHVTVTIDDSFADKPAADFVFDLLGVEDLDALAAEGVVAEAELPDLRAIQSTVFDRDDEGFFIRDGVAFTSNGREVDPDQPLAAVLTKVDRDGLTYRRCDMTIHAPGSAPAAAPPSSAPPAVPSQSREEQMQLFGKMLFLHQIARGFAIDVTRDDPDLIDFVALAEKEQLIEIDTARAAYALSAAGRRLHDQWLEEAQELIHRYDIFGDVDMDSSGAVRFDSHVGQDWRVPVYELANVDPFKARFLIGLNDGEWDHLDGWQGKLNDEKWYAEIFAPIEAAPSVEDLGRDRLVFVMEEARTVLREDGAFQ